MAKSPIQILALNQAEWLKGAEVIVVGGTAFSKPDNGVIGYQPSMPASGDELVRVISAGANGEDGFYLEVARPSVAPDPVNVPVEYIFSAENADGIYIQPQITRNGETEDLNVADTGSSDGKSAITLAGKTRKISPVVVVGILFLAIYGAVNIGAKIIKAATKTTI